MRSPVIFVMLLPLLAWTVKAKECSVADALKVVGNLKPITVVGQPAPAEDDGLSKAYCPEGYYVGKCTANLEGVARYDGIRLLATRGCEAVNSNQKLTNLTATALCIPVTYYAQNIKSEAVCSEEENVDYTCPEGYVMDSCYGVNYYSQKGRVKIIQGSNRCSWRRINRNRREIPGMKLTFICLEV